MQIINIFCTVFHVSLLLESILVIKWHSTKSTIVPTIAIPTYNTGRCDSIYLSCKNEKISASQCSKKDINVKIAMITVNIMVIIRIKSCPHLLSCNILIPFIIKSFYFKAIHIKIFIINLTLTLKYNYIFITHQIFYFFLT